MTESGRYRQSESQRANGVHENRGEFIGQLAAIAAGSGIGLKGVIDNLTVRTVILRTDAVSQHYTFEARLGDTELTFSDGERQADLSDNLDEDRADWAKEIYGSIENKFSEIKKVSESHKSSPATGLAQRYAAKREIKDNEGLRDYVRTEVEQLSDEEKAEIVGDVEKFRLLIIGPHDGFKNIKRGGIVNMFFPRAAGRGDALNVVREAYDAITRSKKSG